MVSFKLKTGMKKIASLIWILLINFHLMAQEPEWLDPVSRANQFPQEKYLTAFGTEVLSKNQSETEAQSKLYEVIKSQISDAILVSINAQTTLNITVENAATDQKMERQSASSSEVELVGLKLDSYFDKRKKSLHAFGYVSIDELAAYHRKNIMEKDMQVTQNLQNAASSTQKSEKIQLYVLNKSLLSGIQKSARLLTALSLSHGADIATLQTTANKNNQLLDQLFHQGTVTVDHLAIRLAGELLNSIPNGSNLPLKSQSINYSNSGVNSELSRSLQQQLGTLLGSSQKITLNGNAAGKISGSFILNDRESTFSATITDENGRIISATEFAVQTDLIDTKGQKLLPPNFEYIPDLSAITIAAPESFSIKPSEYTNKALTFVYALKGQPISNLPVNIQLENDGKKSNFQSLTDPSGSAIFNLDESKVVPGTEYLVTATIDLASFLAVEKTNPFIQYIYNNQRIPTHDLALSVLSPLVYLSSTEQGINGPLNVKVLEPAVKAGMASLRYAFTESSEQADYLLNIEAQARQGQAGEIATLTFVDATISLVNRLTGKEIYKNSFFNIKGLGANFDVAQANAFQKTKTQMVDDITYELEYKR